MIIRQFFSARFDKQKEDGEVLGEIVLFIILKFESNLTESGIDNIDVTFEIERKIQRQEIKDLGWSFDKINSMTIYFYKTGELNGFSFVKIPLRSSAFIRILN